MSGALPSVRVLSQRGLRPTVPRCMGYEFEDRAMALLGAEIFLLVNGIAASGARPHAVALDRLHQDDHRFALYLQGLMIGRVNLEFILSAPLDLPQFLIGQGVHHPFQLGLAVHPVFPLTVTRQYRISLVVTVEAFLHAVAQNPLIVLRQQTVPAAAPDHLDNMPPGTSEGGFQFLDDLAVAPDRPVQALQIAIDHQDQIVQPLPGRDRQRAQHLRFVTLAIADETPDLAAALGLEAAVVQVFDEAGLIDGGGGGQTHGGIGHLPEPGQGEGVGIGWQPAAGLQLPPEVGELLLPDASFQEGPGVDAGGTVGLWDQQITAVVLVGAAEKMVEADFHERCRRTIGGDMATQTQAAILGLQHHGHGIPAQDIFDALFQRCVAGIGRLHRQGNGVQIGCVERIPGRCNALLAGPVRQTLQDAADTFVAIVGSDVPQGLPPFHQVILQIRVRQRR